MPRSLLLAVLLLPAAAHAQQPVDSLAPRRVAVHITVPDTAKVVAELLQLACTTRGIAINASAWQPPAFTTFQPLLARVAGVQVTPYSGAPGAWSTVRIRGVSNVTGSRQPLYVVDGLPAYNVEATPELWTVAERLGRSTSVTTPHTPTANPFLELPVEEIALVEVLKGAAATARYGSQGSSGVVLISTRRGAEGGAAPQPLRVRYVGWAGLQQVRQRYDLLNARQYAELSNEAALNTGRPAPYPAADLTNLPETDRQDQVFRTAGMQSHSLSADGLAHRTRYYVAANYLQQAGVVRQSGLSHYHLRANLDQYLTARLSLGLRASLGHTSQDYAGTELDAGPLLREALLAPPTPPRLVAPGASDPTVLRQFKYFSRQARTRRLLVQLSADYQLRPDLKLHVRASRQAAIAQRIAYNPDYDAQYQFRGKVQEETDSATSRGWVAGADLRYRHDWGPAHALTAGFDYLYQNYEQRLRQRVSRNVAGSNSGSTFSYGTAVDGFHTATLAVGYTYAGRYEAQASLRTELNAASGSSASAVGVLPGGELRWHVHKEDILANASGLSELILRAGAGQTRSFMDLFATDRTTHYDAGLRLGLFGGRLTVDAAAYQRRTRDLRPALLYTIPNGGNLSEARPLLVALRNRGAELTVSGTWQLGPLAGTSRLAAATNRHQVESIAGVAAPPGYATDLRGLEVGQPLARFLVYEQVGTYPAGSPQAGQMRFRDRNGDGQLNYADAFYSGSGLPRHSLCYVQELQLRRLQLTAQLDGLFGYQLYNPTLRALDFPTGTANSSARALNYWTPTNQDTDVPRPGSAAPAFLSNQALASGNHLRLSQLTLAYEILRREFRYVSVWVGGQNLFVTGPYRGFDPNVSGGGAAPLEAGLDASVYPVARVWQLGVRGQF